MKSSLTNLTPEMAQAILAKAKEVENDPYRFKSLEGKPKQFVEQVLGVQLWSKQLEILESATKHRRLSVRSGHSVGKSFSVACLVLYWLYAMQGVVVTTAPTWDHVKDVLWKEVEKLWTKAIVKLPGDFLETELKISRTWNAYGLSTNKPSAFQGRHDGRFLFIIDEAAGVPEQVHLEIGNCATGKENHIVLIGNPTSTSGTFYESHNKRGVWKRLHISCLEHPNIVHGREIIPGAVTVEWVEEKRLEWGENHPFWYSRVLGEFPKISNKGVIPLGWVEAAQNEAKRLEVLEDAKSKRIPRVGGLDVARYGENNTVLFVRRGDAIEHAESWSGKSLMETVALAMKAIKDWELKTLVVDASGIGAGVVDRMLELRAPVFAYNGGHRAFTPDSFSNRRSELWWGLRTRFEKQRIWLPPGLDKLVGDLIAPEYGLMPSGRIQVESKEKLLDRGVKSPDWADALVQCYAMDEDPLAVEPEPLPHHADQMPFELIQPPDQAYSQLEGGLSDAF